MCYVCLLICGMYYICLSAAVLFQVSVLGACVRICKCVCIFRMSYMCIHAHLDLIDGRGPGFPRRPAAKKIGPFFPPQNIHTRAWHALYMDPLCIHIYRDDIKHLQTPNTCACRGAPPAPWTMHIIHLMHTSMHACKYLLIFTACSHIHNAFRV
jgi:hypothetical protein